MAKRKNDGMMTIAEYEKLTGRKYEPAETMTLDEYKALYKMVLKLSFDAENLCMNKRQKGSLISHQIERSISSQTIRNPLNKILIGHHTNNWKGHIRNRKNKNLIMLYTIPSAGV